MIQGLYNSANAINVYNTSLAVTANNIANINTPYYKSNTLQLHDLKQGGVAVSSIRQNQSLSYTIQSGRNLDFVIEGKGNFKLNDNGNAYFTRNGSFYLDGKGDIVDSKGRALLQDVVQPGETIEDFSITDEGEITVNDQYRGKIDIYDSYGNKIPEDLYSLKSGQLEVSDVDYAREVVNMMVTQHATSANVASVRTYDEMLGLIVNLVA